MTESEIRQLINRICSGYIFIKNYIIDVPSPQILAEADNVYEKILYNNRFEDILDIESMDFLLLKNKMWSLFDQKTLDEIPKKIDNAKLELYKNFMIPSQQKYIRKELENLRTTFNELYAKKNIFSKYTIEYLADEAKSRFIFSKIILNKNYKRIKVKPIMLDKIMNEFEKKSITAKKYREIARSDEWRSIWSITRYKNFRKIGQEQINLISYTKLYDNVYKHPECPIDSIINDDDALDGWLLYMKQKSDVEKKQQQFEKTSKAKGNEHFIMVKDQEDINSVLSMNDTRAKVIQRKIHKMVEQDGVANELNIQEIRQDAKIIKR